MSKRATALVSEFTVSGEGPEPAIADIRPGTSGVPNMSDSAIDGIVHSIARTFRDHSSTSLKTASDVGEVGPLSQPHLHRAITRATMLDKEEGLLQERSQLLKKKFSTGLSAREQRHLTYVLWQIDRIDDARVGDHLDKMEEIAVLHTHFADTMESWLRQIEEARRANPQESTEAARTRRR